MGKMRHSDNVWGVMEIEKGNYLIRKSNYQH